MQTPKFLQRVSSWFGKGRPPKMTRVVYTDSDQMWSPAMKDYDAWSDEGYKRCSEVYSCINIIAHTAKSVHWLVYKRTGNKKKALQQVEDYNHPLVRLVRAPNPYQSFPKFVEQLIGYYLVSGNAYIHRVGMSSQPPAELWLLRPDRVKPIPSLIAAKGPIERFDYTIKNNTSKLVPDRSIGLTSWHVVKQFKTFNPVDDTYGLSPIEAAGAVIDQINEAQKLNYNLLKNGARPSGAFLSTGPQDEELQAQLRRQLDEAIGGSANAGKQLILWGDLDWKEMGMKPHEMDWIEGQKMNTRRICSTFGVPPELIGDAQNKTYNNQKEARRALYMEKVLPLLDEVQDELNQWLVPLFGDDLVLSYNRDDIEAVRDDRNAVWSLAINAVNAGVLTPNEGRDAIDYEALNDPDANKLRQPQIQSTNFGQGEKPKPTL